MIATARIAPAFDGSLSTAGQQHRERTEAIEVADERGEGRLRVLPGGVDDDVLAAPELVVVVEDLLPVGQLQVGDVDRA